jgi:hypothetical protein
MGVYVFDEVFFRSYEQGADGGPKLAICEVDGLLDQLSHVPKAILVALSRVRRTSGRSRSARRRRRRDRVR